MCDAETLKAQGEQLADSVVSLGTELASNALLGGIGKLADVLKDVADFAGDSAYTIYRRLRDRLREDTPVARLCSFAGDTLVVTDSGYLQIQDIVAGKDRVWAKDEHTGQMGWQDVLAHYSNRYEETVHVSAVDSAGDRQSIRSNRIHP